VNLVLCFSANLKQNVYSNVGSDNLAKLASCLAAGDTSIFLARVRLTMYEFCKEKFIVDHPPACELLKKVGVRNFSVALMSIRKKRQLIAPTKCCCEEDF